VTLREGLHRELGLTDDELQAIIERLGRDPSYTELAMFSVMWSEHCSYKSSRSHLASLPTEGPHILVGPGEGAGIIEVAPGVSVAWKIESHNHPSFVEPFNGAATGVGGIVRDILSMGARPIALMDPLRFGHLDDARTRYLVDGVVHGISSYGNSIGVPTVGGELVFEECYEENPLVNVACLGLVDGRLMSGRADVAGHSVVLFGSATGRDGIGGASVLASAEFDEHSHEKRPSVQVGDPLTEKLLIEASLELIRDDLVAGFQDLGAGGLSCPTAEMAAKSHMGMDLDLDRVHLREADMEPFEVMISESQERMLAVVEPGNVGAVLEICGKWGLEASAVGEVTSSGNIHVRLNGATVAEVPAESLADEGPLYDRPRRRPDWLDALQARAPGDDSRGDLEKAFLEVLGSPSVASKRWAWEQYDHMLFLGTVQGPGGDAAVLRLPGTDTAVAVTTDGPGRFCFLDPYEGAKLAVAEAARNVACVGARPVAITNCLNFGSPERPEVMWQFAEVVRGIRDACEALATPVTGGNVSFYNETQGRAIYPTPVIGMLGVLESAGGSVGLAFGSAGDALVLLGETRDDDFGGSEYAKVVNHTVAGRPPVLDLEAELRLQGVLIEAATRGLVRSSHDLSSGGLAITLAESALAGRIGFALRERGGQDHRWLFSESPSRAIVTCSGAALDEVLSLASDVGLPASTIGEVGGDALDFAVFALPLELATRTFEDALPSRLSATMA